VVEFPQSREAHSIGRNDLLTLWDRAMRELGLLFLPSRISVRTGLHLEPVLPSNSPTIRISFKPFYPPWHKSFIARQAPRSNSPFFPSPLRSPVQTFKFQVRVASRSARFPSSSSVLRKRLSLPEINLDTILGSTLPFHPA